MIDDDLKGCSLADVLERLEKGKIGHRAAMEWLNVKSYDELVEIMHFNGRLMPGHQPMRVSPETRALVRSLFRPVPKRRQGPVRKYPLELGPSLRALAKQSSVPAGTTEQRQQN